MAAQVPFFPLELRTKRPHLEKSDPSEALANFKPLHLDPTFDTLTELSFFSIFSALMLDYK